MYKVMITGGSGFIGYHLAKYLARKNRVVIVDNLFRGKMDEDFQNLLKHPHIQFINCDLTNPTALKTLPKDIRYIYHLAAINGTKYFYEMPDAVLKVNILTTINILDWFLTTPAEKILFSSSSETYAGTMRRFGLPVPTPEDVPLCVEDVFNPRWSYGGSKIASELLFVNYARVHKRPVTIVRYHNAYGPRMGHEHVIPELCARIIRKTNPLPLFGGKETRVFCYIDDIVRATHLCMESEKTNNQIVNIGSNDEEISIEHLAQKLIALAKSPVRLTIKPAPQGSVSRRKPDIRKLQKLTGFTPRVSLTQGLKKTFDWYKVQQYS